MDLGSVFSAVSGKLTGKNDSPESFLAVKISSTSVLATVWSIENGQVVVGDVGSASIIDDSWTSLLHAADQAVSAALKEETMTSAKTIFALPYDWVAAGKIVPEQLKSLRNLCKELDLSPQGFVMVSEALENFYKEVDGAPLTAILIGIDASKSLLTMYRAGKNLGTTSLGLEEYSPTNVAPAVAKVLKSHTASEVLPSRIIIYDGKGELEEVADQLTAYPWTKQLPFLHFPKVEIAPAEQVVKAIAVAGGIQMGGKFDLGENEVETITTVPKPPAKPETTPEEEILTDEVSEVSPEQAGFITEEINDGITIPIQSGTSGPIVSEKPTVGKRTFGQLEEFSSSVEPEKPKTTQPLAGFNLFAMTNKIMPSIKQVISFITTFTTRLFPVKLAGSSSNKPKKIVTTVGIILAIVIFISALIVYFAPQVTVIVKVSPQSFDREMEVTVVTDNTTIAATNSSILVGNFIDATEVGAKKGVASGRKLVGEKAKGSVTIYSASSSRTFPSGTPISSPDGVKFTIDHDVTVASASDFLSPATISTTITASGIGDTYNLASGTKFTIGSLSPSQYLAKNESAFSGGNSHQATVVTKTDQDRLVATLSAELTDKARSDLESKLIGGQNLLPNAIAANISKKSFSKDVDMEADTVNLDMTMDFRGVVFTQADLVNLFIQKFSSDIPGGFNLSADTARIEVKSTKNDKRGNSLLLIRLSTQLLPTVDKAELTKKISGKGLAAATTIINTIPNITEVNIDTKPRLLAFVSKFFLPWKKDHIKIEIVSN